MKVYRYDSFTKVANKGNPAGVVFDAHSLSTLEMQEIAMKVGFNETAFILDSDKADIRIRYFTPGHEMNLCGHGTIASLFALYDQRGNSNIRTIETKAGILSVSLIEDDHKEIKIRMEQSSPKFMEFEGDKTALAQSIGISNTDINEELPIMYGNTGTWTLLVPVNGLEVFSRMEPENWKFPEVLSEIPKCSVHPFCLEAYDEDCMVHARHFSSPFSGTVEDTVTGTASGVIGAYYTKYISNASSISFIVEQGNEVKSEGKVYVEVQDENGECKVCISGYCAYNKVIEL